MVQSLQRSLVEHHQRNAFCIDEKFYSYAYLLLEVKKISAGIQASGAGKSKKIGIVTTNSIQTYASIIACWFSGCAYIPLNPKLPAERNAVIIEQSDIDLILTSEPGLIEIEQMIRNPAVLDTSSIKGGGDIEFNILTGDDNRLMYILFTSGSTGVPKGVPIDAGNVKAFLKSYDALQFQCSEEDRFLQMFDLTFDVSVASYLVPLLKGACVYTVSPDGIKYMNVYRLLRNHQITFASLVPSIINYLKPYYQEISLPFLRYCILTAEASNVENVKLWSACIPNSKIWNLYGPTEATIWCTAYEFSNSSLKSYHEMLAIGKPFSQVQAFIINEAGEKAMAGEKGELCISSRQLTKGYLNDIEKTQSVFVEVEGIRSYKTGDLCYIDEQGDIIYCGRTDYQVKIQGFRIELSEIEVTVRELYQKNNVAIPCKNSTGSDQICLFVETAILDAAKIKQELADKLPYYMVPSVIRQIDKLPVNISGKIDRNKLKELLLIV